MAKVMLVVMDSVGIGSLPDADLYGDAGSNTICHVAQAVAGLRVPNLASLGLGRIVAIEGVPANIPVSGAFGKMAEVSHGKDTMTGHWEIAGLITKDPMPTFPHGFPRQLIEAFEERIERKVLGNKVASGTEIIGELGEEHLTTGRPIVYTSADSVFQIAAHEDIIPLEDLYKMCRIARELLTGEWAVGRVIARPFIGTPGQFTRTANRHDFALRPPQPTVLDAMKDKNLEVIGIGKIGDIFAGRGLTASMPTKSNAEGVEKTVNAWKNMKEGLVFTNLVEFDSAFGHRNNPQGYAAKLEELDGMLPELVELAQQEGLLIITADHGNDPTTSSTDHCREYVPLLVCGKDVLAGTNLGVRETFADIAATLTEIFGLAFDSPGKSFLPQLTGQGRR